MAGILRAVCYSLVLVLLVSATSSAAKEFLVGGKTDGWKIPSSQSDSLNKWAETTRFLVGDSLVWKYEKEKDSVLKVRREAYISCNTTDAATEEYKDGNTKVTLDKSGPHYFISGAEGHCEKGQKLIVVVMSQRHRLVGESPAPSPAEIEGPAVAPTSGAASFRAGCLVALGVLVGFLWM